MQANPPNNASKGTNGRERFVMHITYLYYVVS